MIVHKKIYGVGLIVHNTHKISIFTTINVDNLTNIMQLDTNIDVCCLSFLSFVFSLFALYYLIIFCTILYHVAPKNRQIHTQNTKRRRCCLFDLCKIISPYFSLCTALYLFVFMMNISGFSREKDRQIDTIVIPMSSYFFKVFIICIVVS